MSDQPRLVRAICEQPAEDTSRLAYADWLDEFGEPARAEFIRVQVEIARLKQSSCVGCWVAPRGGPCCHGRDDLQKRERELLDVAAAEDWAGFPAGVEEWWFRRGFVSEVRCPLATLLGIAADLFARHPVTRVVVTDRRPLRFEGRWLWHNAGHRLVDQDADGDLAHPDHLPEAIHHALEGHTNKPPRVLAVVKGYRSVADANAALSAAIVALCRERAGLPPLPDTSNVGGAE